MSAEHSKLPFTIERDTGDGTAIDTTLWIVTTHDADKATVARIDEPDTMDERNAQYIVKACNAFPQLVDALQRASSRLSETATDGDEKQDALQIIQDALDSVGGTSGN